MTIHATIPYATCATANMVGRYLTVPVDGQKRVCKITRIVKREGDMVSLELEVMDMER